MCMFELGWREIELTIFRIYNLYNREENRWYIQYNTQLYISYTLTLKTVKKENFVTTILHRKIR